MQEYLDSMVINPEQEGLTCEELFYGDTVSDEIEIYNWSER